MQKDDNRYQEYMEVLTRELVPAMGCTEPIAIAYTAALARDTLGEPVDRVKVYASGDIVKNVQSVIVPNTGNKKGIETAAAIGIVAGKSEKNLEVISDVSDEGRRELDAFMQNVPIHVFHVDSENPLEITIAVYHGSDSAKVKVAKEHSNVVHIERNGHVLYARGGQPALHYGGYYDHMSMEGIYDFAVSVDLQDVQPILHRQIAYNTAIAEEGMRHPYGAAISRMILQTFGDHAPERARAMAAAGSDARMSGCDLPVIINSGSGNQGITASMPVVEYAKELGSSEEMLYRALTLSNLATIYQKIHIGRLSAYCGAVSAGAGAGAGITYLKGGTYEEICYTIINALAITSGMICDGAKPSCAAKISVAVEAGLMGSAMSLNHQNFSCGDGIVGDDIEATIKRVGMLARDGMKGTDEEIMKIMLNQ